MNTHLNKYLTRRQFFLTVFILSCSYSAVCNGFVNKNASGQQIMEEVYERHQQYPYIYEEQSMVMVDRNGDRDTRKLKRYTRIEEDGTTWFLLLFESPKELNGVALLANRHPNGTTKKYIYLPAFGEELIENSGEGSNENFLGTDFSIENLTGEDLSEHQYIRRSDTEIEGANYFILDVYDINETGPYQQLLRRHFIRQDNFYITMTYHYDRQGRLSEIQSHHDLISVDGNMWRANMILMENRKEQHQSLIKITRRVFSHDYVPAEIFTAEWLYKNYPYIEPEEPETEMESEIMPGDIAE